MIKKGFGILLVLLCNFAFVSSAQKPSVYSQPYRPGFEKGSIKAFLDAVTRDIGLTIEYSSNSIDTGKLIKLTGDPGVLGNVLEQVLTGQKINVVEKNNKIILVPSSTPLAENTFNSYYSIFGFVKEASSKEPLPDASILEVAGRSGALSNAYGYYTLSLRGGRQTLWISYAGYKAQKLEVDLQSNTRIDVELHPKTDIESVTITSNGNTPGKTGVDNEGVEENPFNLVMGESDPVRTLYLLPGVTSIPDISNGMLVRGGSPDQNVLLMDGNPIFNPTHMLGTISIINKTSLKSLHLYKNNFPSRYGGALSSVIDVLTKDGNMQQWKAEANAGLLAGSFTVNGPIIKDRTAVMLAFRQSWVNPFLRVMQSGFNVNFYDLNFKCTQMVGTRDKLMLNIYAGHDKLSLLKDNVNNHQQWGNKAASLVWNRVLGPKAFINSSVNFSNYENIGGFRYSLTDSTGTIQNNRVYNTFSSIQQMNLRTEVELFSSNRVKFNFGGKISYSHIKPFNTNVAEDFVNNPDDFRAFPRLNYNEFILFYENEIRVTNQFFLRPGLHMAAFHYNNFRNTSLQPRMYARYKIDQKQQLDFSFNHMTQNVHLVTNPYLGINSDAWVPSTSMLSPEESNMINAGYSYHNKKTFTASADIYYKRLKNVTNYVEGKNLFLNNTDWEQYLQSGKGWGYGLEIKLEKKTARWQTTLMYNLSWSWRQFKEINNGLKFPYKYDRRHGLNVAATYSRNIQWDFSALWTFATGDVYTLPDKVYADFDFAQRIIDPLAPPEYRLIYHSSATNQYRTLPYHRMDISSRYHFSINRRTRSVFTMGIYNVYGSPSQYLYDFEGTIGKSALVVTSRYKLFSITPYISYSVIF